MGTPTPAAPSRERQSAALVVAVPLLAAALAAIARLRPLQGGDVLWQIRSGEEVLRRHARLSLEIFSWGFRGRSIHDHEAGFEAVVAALHRVAGFPGLWWGALVFVGCFAALSAHAARSLVPETSARVVGVAAVVAAIGGRSELRAELATFTAIALAHAGRRRGSRVAPVFASAVGAAFHGLAWWTCVVPIAHAVDGAMARKWREVAVDLGVAVGCLAAAEVVSPGLFRLNVESVSGSAIIHHVNELKTPYSLLVRGVDPAPALAHVLGIVAAIGLLRVRARADALFVALLCVPGLRYARFGPLASFAAMPWAIAGIAAIARPALRRRDLGAGLPAIACAVAILAVTPTLGLHARIVGFDFESQPVEAVRFLREHRPDAALFHPYNFGSYLIFDRYPPRGVVIDPRAQMVYPDAWVTRYYQATEDPASFESWAREAPFDAVLLSRSHKGTRPLREHLLASPSAWRLAYSDGVAMVFFRR